MANFKETTPPIVRTFVLEMNEDEVKFLKWLATNFVASDVGTRHSHAVATDLYSLLVQKTGHETDFVPNKCWKENK